MIACFGWEMSDCARRRTCRLALCVLLACLAGVAASGSDWKAPEKEAARANPLAGSPELAAGGGKMFARRCASCHADDGHGLRQAANLRSPAVQAQSDGAIFWKMSSGHTRRGMPSFSSLPEKQRWQLVLFIRTLADKSALH